MNHELLDVQAGFSKGRGTRDQNANIDWIMAKVNVNILGISELKWTGIGKFNSDDHYIYYCGLSSSST